MAKTSTAQVVVEIPVDEEHQKKMLSAITTTLSAIQNHPLMEISESPGHLLLLKLWQREEDIFGKRVSLKETRLNSLKREVFQLLCFFGLFHFLLLTLLFTSSINRESHSCRKWWVPSVLATATSLVFVVLTQVKIFRFWKVWRQVQREKSDNRALSRCIQELRMKGESFDLSKEPQTGKRMKSSSVEIKWKSLTWCHENLISISLLCLAGLAIPASKLILCGF